MAVLKLRNLKPFAVFCAAKAAEISRRVISPRSFPVASDCRITARVAGRCRVKYGTRRSGDVEAAFVEYLVRRKLRLVKHEDRWLVAVSRKFGGTVMWTFAGFASDSSYVLSAMRCE